MTNETRILRIPNPNVGNRLFLAVAHLRILLSNEVEMGTDTDILIPREARYPNGRKLPTLIAQTSLAVSQDCIPEGTTLATIHPESGRLAQLILQDRLAEVPHTKRAGLPCQGPKDPRWNFKLQELEALQTIAATKGTNP